MLEHAHRPVCMAWAVCAEVTVNPRIFGIRNIDKAALSEARGRGDRPRRRNHQVVRKYPKRDFFGTGFRQPVSPKLSATMGFILVPRARLVACLVKITQGIFFGDRRKPGRGVQPQPLSATREGRGEPPIICAEQAKRAEVR